MWSKYVENKGLLKGTYKDTEPSLSNICIKDFTIITGEDVRVIMTFDTSEMPINIPEEWLKMNVNTIQFKIEFIDVNLNLVNINRENFQNVEILIHPLVDKNQVVFLDNYGNIFIDLDVKWIYLKKITGYQNTVF